MGMPHNGSLPIQKPSKWSTYFWRQTESSTGSSNTQCCWTSPLNVHLMLAEHFRFLSGLVSLGKQVYCDTSSSWREVDGWGDSNMGGWQWKVKKLRDKKRALSVSVWGIRVGDCFWALTNSPAQCSMPVYISTTFISFFLFIPPSTLLSRLSAPPFFLSAFLYLFFSFLFLFIFISHYSSLYVHGNKKKDSPNGCSVSSHCIL